MLTGYKTVLEYAEVEHLIEKSRFIGYVKPIQSEVEAIEFIENIRSRHKNATHNVPVYVFGDNNEIQRYSDDGEPAGTAGVPVLEMLKKEEIKNIVMVITRYFGGIKLGTGGLVRAYTSTAKLALNQAKVIEKILYHVVKIRMDYSAMGKIQNEILNTGYVVKDTVFDDGVNMFVYVKVDQSHSMIQRMVDITNAKAEISVVDTLYLNEYNGVLIQK